MDGLTDALNTAIKEQMNDGVTTFLVPVAGIKASDMAAE